MTELDPTAIGALGLLIPAVVLLIVVLYLVPVPLWIAAWSSGAYVGLMTLVGMRLRRVPPATIVNARISAVKAGLQGSRSTTSKRITWPAATSCASSTR